jgi:hypothetical protein
VQTLRISAKNGSKRTLLPLLIKWTPICAWIPVASNRLIFRRIDLERLTFSRSQLAGKIAAGRGHSTLNTSVVL